jgi:hypothetical protein
VELVLRKDLSEILKKHSREDVSKLLLGPLTISRITMLGRPREDRASKNERKAIVKLNGAELLRP